MNGFIFGFQRFVWCPKWTPASKSSGTNSVVSAIGENPREGTPERDGEDATARVDVQPEIQRYYCSHKACIGTLGNGLWMPVCRALRHKTGSGSRLTRRACPPSQKDVNQQQDRQSQADSEMDPTRPRTQSFAARVIKAVAGDGQNGECAQKH